MTLEQFDGWSASQVIRYQILSLYDVRYTIEQSAPDLREFLGGDTVSKNDIDNAWHAMVKKYHYYMAKSKVEGDIYRPSRIYRVGGFENTVRQMVKEDQKIFLDVRGSKYRTVNAIMIGGRCVCWPDVKDNKDIFDFTERCIFIEELFN